MKMKKLAALLALAGCVTSGIAAENAEPQESQPQVTYSLTVVEGGKPVKGWTATWSLGQPETFESRGDKQPGCRWSGSDGRVNWDEHLTQDLDEAMDVIIFPVKGADVTPSVIGW